jgi:hypothetical protein
LGFCTFVWTVFPSGALYTVIEDALLPDFDAATNVPFSLLVVTPTTWEAGGLEVFGVLGVVAFGLVVAAAPAMPVPESVVVNAREPQTRAKNGIDFGEAIRIFIPKG